MSWPDQALRAARAKDLVLASGGEKCLCYIGALQYMKVHWGVDYGARHPAPHRIFGSSGGALIGFAIALGCSVEELYALTYRVAECFHVALDPTNLIETGGMSSHERLRTLIRKLLKAKTGRSSMKLGELAAETGVKFHSVLLSTHSNRIVWVGPDEDGDWPLEELIVASVSIPLLFQSVPYCRESFVDGGLLKSFPIDEADPAVMLGLRTIYTDPPRVPKPGIMQALQCVQLALSRTLAEYEWKLV
jgi:predicted acylesterase/phospholipase RssA